MNLRIMAMGIAAGIFLQAAQAAPLESAGVNAFDRFLMYPYSRPLDLASEITQYSAFLAPAAFLAVAVPPSIFGIGAMYAGSTCIAYGWRTGLKALVKRDRPYMYFENAPADEIADGDSAKSFPSGHTIMAFTGAAFAATLFALRYPSSKYRIPVVGAAYTLAIATAALRVASGSHFATDVMAGALIGTFSGFIVPWTAVQFGVFPQDGGKSGKKDQGETFITATPAGIVVTHNF